MHSNGPYATRKALESIQAGSLHENLGAQQITPGRREHYLYISCVQSVLGYTCLWGTTS